MDALNGYFKQLLDLTEGHHAHVVLEAALVLVILYIVLVKRAYDPAKKGYGARAVLELTEKEKEEIIADWEPEALVSAPKVQGRILPTPDPSIAPHTFTITDFVPGGHNVVVHVDGDAREKVTFCSEDFLGLGDSADVRTTAVQTLEEYSLGSCGPRGFYGTTRKHLELEEELAAFMDAPESITYSDAMAAVASAIPAFAKRGDVLLVDAGCNHAVMTGVRLSRSKIITFKHNDMADLEAQLKAIKQHDATVRDTSLSQRRFIVVEGLYANFGDVCPMDQVVRLARAYCFRTIVDDSLGFGVLGATGRGVTQHFGLNPLDVDVLLGSLSTTLAAVGGFCVGSREVVDHQRLSGAGYCFSASAPPYLCATATAALRGMKSNAALLAQLQSRSKHVHSELVANVPNFKVVSDPLSPVKHLLLATSEYATATRMSATPSTNVHDVLAARLREEAVLRRVAEAAQEEGVLVTWTHYLPTELSAPRPTLKVDVTLAHTDAQLAKLVTALKRAAAVLDDAPCSAASSAVVAAASTATSTAAALTQRKRTHA